MTQAQKTAKAKFKQAIAYRQKTGVSLKEAFAHIYGKKVGAVKKKSAPKKKAAKKVVRKKVAKKKLIRTDYDKRYQAKKPGKRKSASGKTYYEKRANRSDKGKMLGIKNESKILDDYKTILGKVSYYQNTIQMYRDAIKNYKTRGISPAQLLNLKLWIKTHSKLLSEYKIHAKQLKKLI
jgi:hypothetical protein